jgi:hypothetical protein
MPAKRTTLSPPMYNVSPGSPSGSVDTYYLTPEELAAINAKYPRKSKPYKHY